MKVVVIGRDSFVVSRVLEVLSMNYKVLGVDMPESNQKKSDGFDLVDKFKDERCFDTDIFICIGDLTCSTEFNRHQQDSLWREIKKCYDYFLFSKAQKFIYVRNLYSEKKRSLTQDLTLVDEKPFLLNLESEKISKKVYVLQVNAVYGPYYTSEIFEIYLKAAKGLPFFVRYPDSKVWVTALENLVYVISDVIGQEREPGIYNVVDDSPTSIRELVQTMQVFLGRRVRIYKYPSYLICFLSLLGLTIHNSCELKSLSSRVVSNRKILKELGINSMPYSLQEDFIDTLHSYRNM